MPKPRARGQRAQRVLTPLIIALGPLLSAAVLTALAFYMFRSDQGAAFKGLNPLENTVILALAGALIALLMAALGLALYNSARKAQNARDEALAEGLTRLARIDSLVRRIGQRGEWREAAAATWARRQRRALEATAALTEPRANLQRVASDIWAGMSQPGAPIDAYTALRLARESAVASAALGAAVDDLCALLAAPQVELDEMKSAGDAIFEDLSALDDLARHARLMLSVAAGDEGEALTGAIPAQRAQPQPPTIDPGTTGAHPAAGQQPPMPSRGSGALGGAPIPPRTAQRPAIRGAGDPGWSTSGRLPQANPGDSGPLRRPPSPRDQRQRPPERGHEWRAGDSGPHWRDPRNRGDNNSRWLND